MKVSVIIPCLDAEAYLGVAIRSLLNQTRPPYEIIVADNRSADASRDVALGFGGPVRLVDVPERGASRARLAGLAEAAGEALMFCDADDLLAPETLEALTHALEAGEGDIACAPWYRFEQGAGGAWHWAPPSCAPRRTGQDDLSAWLTGWYHPPCSVLWSRAGHERSGGWDPAIGVNDDGDVMMRGLARGNLLARTQRGAGFYRRLPQGGSLSAAGRTPAGLASRLAVLEKVMDALDETARIAAYRDPLEQALAAIIADVHEDAPAQLGEACEALTQRLRAPLRPLAPRAAPPQPCKAPAPAPARTVAPTPTADRPLRVSVVIPAYNRAATIARAIGSALAQDPSPLEVIVVDDGSTDATPAVVAAIGDPRLRLVTQPNGGVAAARNRGIAEARGELVAFLDSDDEWLPGKLAAQLAAFRAGGPQLGLVYTGFESVAADGTATRHHARHRGWIYRDLLARNVVTGCGSTVIVSREALDLVGGFDTALPANEDYDFVLRIARFFAADCIAAPLARYHDAGNAAAGSGAVRVSRRADANRASRAVLLARYGEDMRRAGTAHLFFIASAERELYLAGGNLMAAARAAARAILSAPRRPWSYRWAFTHFLPRLLARLMDRPAPGNVRTSHS